MDQDRPPLAGHEDIAGSLEMPLETALEQTLLLPELSEEQVVNECARARRFRVGAVVVRPCDVDSAVRALGDSGVEVASVCGYPHGFGTTGTKLYELRDLLRRGAKRIAMALNTSKLISRQFQHVETELLQAADACHKERASLTVVFDDAHMNDEHIIVACRICARVDANFVATEHAKLARTHLREDIGLASRNPVTLDEALEACNGGFSRIVTSEAFGILDERNARRQAARTAT